MSVNILAHVLPEHFRKHEKQHWHALEHRWRPPFLLTTDNFGAATNVWPLDQLAATSSNEQSDPQPILLNPPLPYYQYGQGTSAHVVSPNERFLAITVSSESSARWGVYDLSTGSLVSESGIEGYSYSGEWRNAGQVAALAVEGGGKQAILRYKLTDEGILEQLGCAVPAPPGQYFGFEHLAKDGSIFTCVGDLPSRHPLTMAYYPPHSDSTTIPATLDIPFTTEGKGAIWANGFIQVSERSLAFVAEENEWGADMSRISAFSTVRLVTYTACPTPSDKPHISLSWTVRLEHAVDQLAYVPSLGTGTIVVRGQWHAPYIRDGSRDPNKLVLIFLDASTGTLLKKTEQTYNIPDCRCIGPNWVVFDKSAQIPWLYAIPLARVMEIGLEGMQDSEGEVDAQAEVLQVLNGPEPWNSKKRKAAERGQWKWVTGVEFLSDGKLVLFYDRGPEFWVLDHTAVNCA